MNNNQKYNIDLDFNIKGQKEVTSFFLQLGNLFDSEKIKTEASKVHASVLGLYKSVQKDIESGGTIDIKNSGLVKTMEGLAKFLDKIQGKVITEDADQAILEYDKKIKEAEDRGKKAQAAIEKLDKEMNARRSSVENKIKDGGFGVAFDPELANADNLVKKLTEVRVEMEKLEKEGGDTTGLKKQEKALLDIGTAIRLMNNDLMAMGRQKGGHASQRTKAANAVERLGKEQLEAVAASPKEISDATKAYEELLKVLNTLRELHLQEAVRDETQAQEENTKVTNEATAANKKLDEATSKSTKTLARKVLEGFSYYAIFNRVKQLWSTSLKVIQELDRAMVEAAIVTNMTTKETWKLLGSYQKLADVVGRSTSEIANLNAFFLQQGLTVRNAMEMTEVAAKSAAIAGISLQESADYLTSAINGFGLAASAAKDVADKFAAVGAATAADFEELAIAMSKVAPVAQSAGVGLDFMLGILAKGIHTTREAPENIGTAFKTIFARMRELTDIGKSMEDGMSLNRVEKALQSIGVELRNEVGQFRNLEDVIYDVGYQWKNLDSIQQAYLATALAGNRQQPRLMAILNDFEETVEFIEISKNSAEAMEYQHMEYMSGMEAASQSVRNAWEKVVTSFVDSEAVIVILKAFSKLLNALSKVISFLTTGWGAFIGVMLLSTTIVALMMGSLKGMRAGLIKTVAALQKFTVANAQSTVAVTGLGAAIKFLMGPVGWAIAAVAAFIGVLAVLINRAKEAAVSVQESNKLIYESNQRTEALDKTIARYEALTNQISKTNEELEELIELQNELESFDTLGGDQENFLKRNEVGDLVVDYEKVREARSQEATERRKAEADIARMLAISNKNVKIEQGSLEETIKSKLHSEYDVEEARSELEDAEKDREEKFTEHFTKLGIKSGEAFSQGLADKGLIDKEDLTDINRKTARAMAGIDFSSFISNGSADMSLAKKMGENIAKIISNAYLETEELNKQELNTTEILQSRLESYEKIMKDIEKLNISVEEMSQVKVQLAFEFQDEQALAILKENKIDLQIVGDFIDKGGKLSNLQSILEAAGLFVDQNDYKSSTEYQQKEANRIKTERDQLAIDSQTLTDKTNKNEWSVTGKNFFTGAWWKAFGSTRNKIEKELQKEQDRITNELAALDEAEKALIPAEQLALAKLDRKHIANLLAQVDIKESIQALRNQLVNEEGWSEQDAQDYVQEKFLNKLAIKNESQIADFGNSIGTYMSKAMGLKEDLLKGDFTNYLDLVREFDQESVDAFLETGKIDDLVGKSTNKMLELLATRRAELEGKLLSNTPENADFNKAILDSLRSLDIMEAAMKNINYQMAVYEERSKSAAENFNKANSYLDETKKLLEAGFSADSGLIGFLKGFEEMYRKEAIAESIDNLGNIQKDIETKRAELIEKGLMDVNGDMIYSEVGREYQDAYIELLKSADDAARNITNETLREIAINNEEWAEEIKKSNETYKTLIDEMNKMHKARWDEVDYENKLIDLQKNIYEARNALSAAQVGGTDKQIQDAQEALRRMQQERRKAIEEEAMKQLERGLEDQRKSAEDEFERLKLDANERLIEKLETATEGLDGLTAAINRDIVATEDNTDAMNEDGEEPSKGTARSGISFSKELRMLAKVLD